mgnify:CR=1 FL=1
MNEQFLFYWLSWLLVIIVFFFMNQSKTKSFFLFTLFLVIIFINDTVTIFPYQTISISFVILTVFALIYFVSTSLNIYDLFATLTIIVAYTALLLWAKVAPIWFVIHPYLLVPILIYIFISSLYDQLTKQVVSVSLSLTIGHYIYGVILFQYQLKSNVNESFFIYLYITILLLILSQLMAVIIKFVKRKIVSSKI